jgi:DNA-binding MarR family transcriptional regulator
MRVTSKKPKVDKAPQPMVDTSEAVPAKRAQALAVTQRPSIKKAASKALAKNIVTTPVSTAGSDDYVLEEQIGFRLRKAHQRASVIFAEVMASFDVTPTQFAALAKLHDVGPISQNQLGRLTAMDPATILGVVGRLQRQGLLRARASIEDARLMVIELTAEGQTRIKEMKSAGLKVSARTLSPLKPDEAKTLNALLARLG